MDFDIDALYRALDQERQARGLSWTGAAREIGRRFERSAAFTRPVSASTVTGIRKRRVVEGDGVLQMLRWLNRAPESFSSNSVSEDLPIIPANRILRFDSTLVYRLLDDQRRDRGLTWAEVGRQIGGTTPSSLTRLANGGRVAFPWIMRVLRWLNRSVASVTRASMS